ncbi:MAG: MOSC domain-containing protein, partial [Candidatus Schmidhempelia sp.]|nr:MOSC domain-containing protein [Candidatus Schmidhempelia sp.]
MTMILSQLSIYPIKSMVGLNLMQAKVDESGFEFDRQFMLCQPDGTLITARQYPQLLLLKPHLTKTGIVIFAPNNSTIMIHYNEFSNYPESTNIGRHFFYSYLASIKVNRWFSDYLQCDVQLRWLGNTSSRRVKHFSTFPRPCADNHPYLLINQASFNNVKQRCRQPLTISQFRGNIIIDGSSNFAEDNWKTIKIGDVIFEVTKPCCQSIVTTVDVKTAQPNPNQELFSVLSTFRRREKGEIDFGIMMIALNQGIYQVGDKVELLAT